MEINITMEKVIVAPNHAIAEKTETRTSRLVFFRNEKNETAKKASNNRNDATIKAFKETTW